MIEIIKRVTISNTGVSENKSTTETLREIFHNLKIDYPKFFKMDNLSKLGFLASEILLEGIDNKEDFGIVLCTSSSSLETDMAFQKNIQDTNNFFPSPSVFVYTLPNIVIGEICIRHKIYGENMMFIINENDINDFHHHTKNLIYKTDIKKGITGYIECFENRYRAEFMLFKIN
ncbi:MAG: hypothetical protein LBD23_07315 [Oscillospiraceae bacterium]|nr:hypothetical protein [Oscillospiraceae bacterium]